MGQVRKRGKVWTLDYRVNGKRVRRTVEAARTRKEAERILAQRMTAVYEGTHGLPSSGRLTLGGFVADWLPRHALRLKGEAYSGSTFALYRGYLDRHILPRFGTVHLRNIDTPSVEAFVADLRAGGLAPKTCNNLLGFLKTILGAAELENHILRNPARGVRPLRVPRRPVEVYSPEELRTLLAAADADSYPLLLAAAATGCREGELFAWTWDGIDWRAGTVSVRRRYHKGSLDEPKSASSIRTITLPRMLLDTLAAHRKRQAERHLRIGATYRDGGLVFCGPDGRPLHQSYADRAVKRAAQRAGLRALPFHGLRHTHVSILLAAGENIRTVTARLGHSQVSTTLNVYAHLLPEADKSAARRMDEILGHRLVTKAKDAG